MVSLKKCTFRVIAIVVIIAVIFQFRGAKMSCIFCDIVSKKVNTELLYEDENFIAFKDIKPATQFHFLLIPRKHITNTNVLKIEDKEMVLDMKRIMMELLAKHNQTDIKEILLGFHVPPFNTINHLHLHGIAPTSEMGFIGRLIFRPDSYWFKTVDSIIAS